MPPMGDSGRRRRNRLRPRARKSSPIAAQGARNCAYSNGPQLRRLLPIPCEPCILMYNLRSHLPFSLVSLCYGVVGVLAVVYIGLIAIVMSYAALTVEF